MAGRFRATAALRFPGGAPRRCYGLRAAARSRLRHGRGHGQAFSCSAASAARRTGAVRHLGVHRIPAARRRGTAARRKRRVPLGLAPVCRGLFRRHPRTAGERDGNVITGGGAATAGIDMALAVMAQIAGVDLRPELALEYAPEPPFDSGRPERARPANPGRRISAGCHPRRNFHGRWASGGGAAEHAREIRKFTVADQATGVAPPVLQEPRALAAAAHHGDVFVRHLAALLQQRSQRGGHPRLLRPDAYC